MRIVLLFCLYLFCSHLSKAQYPHYFSYDNEKGLPSNEVYSLLQDSKGFIWLGCDAGLFKFDGIRYNSYQSTKQKSRAVTGLTISSSGMLYCYNFKSQTFYLKGDSLTELPNPGLEDIINMTADSKGNIFVSHLDGISSYNEKDKKWTLLFQPKQTSPLDKNRPVCKASRITSKDELYFICTEGIGQISAKGIQFNRNSLYKAVSPRKLDLVEYKDTLWFFGKEDNLVYRYLSGSLSALHSKKLQSVLYNRKINIARVLQDGNLWICTYKGIICYDAVKDSVSLFYPEIAFSDCILGREGNYWFSTLQEGILCVPNLHNLVWNKENGLMTNDRLSKIANDHRNIYFTTTTGLLGQLDIYSQKLKTYHTGLNADIQSLDYDKEDKTLWFNQNNQMFSLKNGKLNSNTNTIQAVKVRYKIGQDIFQASSHGTFINDQLIHNSWAREIVYNPASHKVWVATNDGLLQLRQERMRWHIRDTLLKDKQLLSIDIDTVQQQLYALTYDGQIYCIASNNSISRAGKVPQGVLAGKLKYYGNSLYLGTNQGLWILNLYSHYWQQINMLTGIASDNIQDLTIANKALWLSTGKGLQKVPLPYTAEKSDALLYLKKISIADFVTSVHTNLHLNYGQTLMLYPEAAIYSCHDNFQYLYRIRNNDTAWVNLPGNIKEIELQNIPSGRFEIELKVIDCFGKDSNIIVIEGYVNPPFWKTEWFLLLIFVIFCSGALLFLRHRIGKLQLKQRKEIEQLNRENELRMAQQRALIAQMNPHFIFNVLNSIKSYIYKNDKEKALIYLDDFSHLVRTVLEMSSVQYTTLATELKILKLYIDLEAMMLPEDFHYQVEVFESLDIQQMKFPSLILQPFIENSFKHGFKTKKGEKYLYIIIYPLSSDSFRLEITDNGIGRQKAEELNNQNSYKRVSFATNAIKHRIALINKDGLLHMDFQTIDLYDSDNKAVGTKIIITIHYNH